MKEQQVDPVPLIAHAKSPLPADEGELAAQLEQEALELRDERLFEFVLGVLVFQVEELEHEGALDGVLGVGQVDAVHVPLGRLVLRKRGAFVELALNLAVELAMGPPAAQRLGLVENAGLAGLHREQAHVVRPGQREGAGHRGQRKALP